MNYKIFTKGLRTLVLMLAALVLAAGPSYAVDLMAVEGTWTPPVGAPITMWGFATDTTDCATAPTDWGVGPQLDDTTLVAGNLTINLRNCLTEPTSIVIPGQPATFAPVRVGNRVTAFTTEAPADGGLTTTTYTWTGVKSGTYLYQSGSHPAKQVQMGLYGALTIGSYPDTSGDVTLLYSEIDPALHSPPTAATPLEYKPRHYLVNGDVTFVPDPPDPVGDTNQPIVLRFLNAGLDFHVPALNGGYMSLVAEDGNAYPFPKEQYSANLAAGKTIDALWQPASAGDHVIYDRRGNGMVAEVSISAGDDVTPPVITVLGTDPVDVVLGDAYTDAGATAVDNVDGPVPVITDNPVNTAIAGSYTVTYTATDAAGNTATATRTVNVIAADTVAPVITVLGANPVEVTLNATYTDAGATAVDNVDGPVPVITDNPVDTAIAAIYTVTYTATDTAGNTATETRTVNVTADTIPPVITVLGANPIEVPLNSTYTDAGATATDNIDGDLGLLVGTDTVDTAAIGVYTVTYTATDTAGNTATATRTVNVTNSAPVAVDDAATVARNSTGAAINLTDNDSDVDGNLKDVDGNVAAGQITITTGATTTRGGTVSVVTNGVIYIPKRNFRGTDTFNYFVTDLAGAESNEVTVRVNVVRP